MFTGPRLHTGATVRGLLRLIECPGGHRHPLTTDLMLPMHNRGGKTILLLHTTLKFKFCIHQLLFFYRYDSFSGSSSGSEEEVEEEVEVTATESEGEDEAKVNI